MNSNNILVNTQSSIKIILDKIIYFDPFQIKERLHDADIIFITHEHYDHFDYESINLVKNNHTIVIAPKSMEKEVSEIEFKDYIFLMPNDEIVIENIMIKAIPAYNIEKNFHPKSNNWLGYLIQYHDTTYYIAGDTDKTKETEKVKCDIALLPIGGKFTMDVDEALELIRIIKPKLVIPTHYGSIVGDKNDGQKFKEKLTDIGIDCDLLL